MDNTIKEFCRTVKRINNINDEIDDKKLIYVTRKLNGVVDEQSFEEKFKSILDELGVLERKFRDEFLIISIQVRHGD